MSDPVVGVDVLFKANTGTEALPVWTPVGGQRGCSMSRKTDEIDASDKTTGGFKKTLAGLLSWGIEADAVLIPSDSGLAALKTAWRNRQQVQVEVVHTDGSGEYGYATITNLSDEHPHDGVSTVKISLSGASVLTPI